MRGWGRPTAPPRVYRRQVLAGMAAAQLAGKDFLVGLDGSSRRRRGPAAPGAGAGYLDGRRDRAPVHRRALAGCGGGPRGGDAPDGEPAAGGAGG